MPGQTCRELQSALRQGPWHIFHFSGHGRFDTITDEGQLAFADDQGEAHLLQASEVGRLWRTIVPCASPGSTHVKGRVAASWISSQACVHPGASGHPCGRRNAIRDQLIEWRSVARTFYEALVDGYPVDAALAEARVAVSRIQRTIPSNGAPLCCTCERRMECCLTSARRSWPD